MENSIQCFLMATTKAKKLQCYLHFESMDVRMCTSYVQTAFHHSQV